MGMSQSSTFFTVVFAPSKQENTLQILGFTKGRLNQRKPRQKGRILYFYKREKMWRPRRIFWEEQGKWKAYPPENTIQEIILTARYIFITADLPNKEKEGLIQFCRDFNLPMKFTTRNFCPFCLFTERITLLRSEGNYQAYGREICKACAMQELEKELQSKKINLLDNPGFKKYAVSILDRFHDIKPVTETLTQGNANLSELTLIKKVDALNTTKNLLKVNNSQISKYLKKILNKRGIDTLLPIQAEALNNGLLKKRNLLIIANTSAGKTLIGEIAGITSSLKKKKFLFVVPLVALANTKYEDFKKFYGNKLRIGIRTGRSRIFDSLNEKKAFYKSRFSIQDSDVIIATYEGLDLLIRGGQVNFSDIGCIVIDEIQTLADPERGPTLDCLQAKIRAYSKNVQIIGLSATIGNPIQFADDLSLKLITVDHRPIPLEQHLLISRSIHEKLRQITTLIHVELKTKSKTGYKGQTIVFTNSRRKTSEIADFLRESGIKNAQAYHSGLSYSLRKQIELDFSSGKCKAIVATYALGAGVDFPASQVIFESMMMGNQILDPNTFTQMIGRAGRLGKHDRGYAVFLCLGESISSLDSKSEVEIALELVNSDLTPITPDYDENACGEQIISICSTKARMAPSEVKKIYQNMIGTGNHDFMQITNKMIRNSLIEIDKVDGTRFLEVTSLGRASALSFFSPEKTIKIKFASRKPAVFIVPSGFRLNQR